MHERLDRGRVKFKPLAERKNKVYIERDQVDPAASPRPLNADNLLVELIDIAEHEGMVEQYGLRIPVLRRCDTGSELNWPFDAEQVVEFLS